MSGSHAYHTGDVPGLAGAYHYGGGGLGTLGSLVPSSGDHGPGFIYPSLNLPADANKEYYGVLGARPAGLTTLTVEESSAVIAAANDGSYRQPFDLYENGVKIGSTYFDIVFGTVAATINLVGSGAAQANQSSAGAATVTPAAKTVNLVGSGSSQGNTSGTGVAGVNAAPKTVNLAGSTSTQTNTSGTGAATVLPSSGQASNVLAPAARTAKFVGRSRVVVFNGNKPVGYQKGQLDELYLVGDVSKDLFEASTTIASVAYASAGVAILEGPYLQSGFPVVKLGAFDMAAPRWFFTFRLTLANGEQIDRTIELTIVDDRTKVFGKDPDDKRFYTFDFSSDATLGGSALSTVSGLAVAGVTSLQTPGLQGNAATVKVGGLDTADGATNSVGLWANFANTERIFRTIYFTQEEH